jgi:hypothetical protein
VNGETPAFRQNGGETWRYGYRISAGGDCGETPTRFVNIYAFVVQIYAFAVLFGVSHVTVQ